MHTNIQTKYHFSKKILGSGSERITMYLPVLLAIWLFAFFSACKNNTKAKAPARDEAETIAMQPVQEPPLAKIPVTQKIALDGFFNFIDKIVQQNDSSSYKLSENLLLRANTWILDTLVNTDYYYQMSLGNFVFRQPKLIVLKPGDTILIPGPATAAALLKKMAKTSLDINIPAFEMRILEGDSVLFAFPVRVGKNQKKHLELAGGTVDLRTRTGVGEIIRVNRNPLFLDPVTGKRFRYTKRDDHQTTYMPLIPWLEPSINGMRYGQMIHPTTNPRTLGKAASNGCIGVGEADGWRVYYFAPLGTKVIIRYDVQTINPNGDTLHHDDIYRLRKTGKTAVAALAGAGFLQQKVANVCLCDTMF